jgi:hypothetical protein
MTIVTLHVSKMNMQNRVLSFEFTEGFFLRLVFEFERNLQFQFRPVLYQYVYVFFLGVYEILHK